MRTHTVSASMLTASFALAALAGTADAGLVINVGFNAQNTTVQLGQQFVVDIVADLPLDVIGWGMEFRIGDPNVVELQGIPLAALPWTPTVVTEFPDHWRFGGLAFPDPVSGQGVHLASLFFKATALGETDLILTIDGSDPTQGFVAGPGGPSGSYPSVQLNLGRVTVVPGPGVGAVLVALGAAAGRGRRRR